MLPEPQRNTVRSRSRGDSHLRDIMLRAVVQFVVREADAGDIWWDVGTSAQTWSLSFVAIPQNAVEQLDNKKEGQ